MFTGCLLSAFCSPWPVVVRQLQRRPRLIFLKNLHDFFDRIPAFAILLRFRYGATKGLGLGKPIVPKQKRKLCVVKDLGDLPNCIPVPGRGRDAEKLLYFAEIADRFHLATIHTEDESVFNRDDLEQPVVV
jgi:hypothetical protein